jgi:hypothetical protein
MTYFLLSDIAWPLTPSKANFVELRKAEVRRIHLLSTRVNISSATISSLQQLHGPPGEVVGRITVGVLVANIEGRVLVS